MKRALISAVIVKYILYNGCVKHVINYERKILLKFTTNCFAVIVYDVLN